MYHTIYKITNKLDGKIYIGKHSSKDIHDNYMGSGKYIRSAIKKYGIENFEKEILFILDSEEEAYKIEKEIVNEDFIKRDDVYNIITGGDMFESINSNEDLRKYKNKKAALSMNKIIWSDPDFRKRNRDRMVEQNINLHLLGILKSPDWTGKKHKDETRKKMSELKKGTGIGEKNSQYGTCWVTKEGINKKIKIEDLTFYIENNWIKGRKLK